MNGIFDNVKIAGICGAVSTNWVPISSFAGDDLTPEMIEKFTKQIGVIGRYNAGIRQTTSDFCYAAAERLISEKQIDKSEIGILAFVSQSADYKSPATACVLHGRLGLDERCLSFDVNLGCSGFTCGMNIVSSLLQSSGKKYALLLCGDTSVREMDPGTITKVSNSARLLFGDGGAATLLELCESCEKMYMEERTQGNGFRTIIEPHIGYRNPPSESDKIKGSTRMDDIEVFNFSTSRAPELIESTMKIADAKVEDYDCLVLHQANLKIIKRIAKLTGFGMEKTLLGLDEFGNTSSASIPLALVKKYGDESRDEIIRAMLCGFGIGLSWSTVDCVINTKDILPLVKTDDYFEDGFYDE